MTVLHVFIYLSQDTIHDNGQIETAQKAEFCFF